MLASAGLLLWKWPACGGGRVLMMSYLPSGIRRCTLLQQEIGYFKLSVFRSHVERGESLLRKKMGKHHEWK